MRPGPILAGFLSVFAALAALIWFNSLGRSNPVEESGPDSSAESDIHSVNPFEDEIADPPPRVEIAETEHFFEPMPVGEHGTHSFVVENVGEGVLKLARGGSTCKCTVGTLGEDEVPPGGRTEITLEWNAAAVAPEFRQSATIFTNDPDQPDLSFVVQGAVVEWTDVFPGTTWQGHVASDSDPTPFQFIIVSQLAESFSITGVETSSDLVQVNEDDVQPIPADELQQYNRARCGYRINGRLGPGFPVGPIREQLSVSTDLEQVPEIQLFLDSQRRGPFQIVGSGWDAPRDNLNLGRFSAADGKSARVSFFVNEIDGFQFTGVQVDPQVINVSWTEDEEFGSSARKRIYIDIVAQPGMPPGRWVREDPIHVTLTTNYEEIPELEFSVSLHAD